MNCPKCDLNNKSDGFGIMNFPDGTALVKCEHCNHLRFNNDNKPAVLIRENNDLTLFVSPFDIKWRIREWRKKRQRMVNYREYLIKQF